MPQVTLMGHPLHPQLIVLPAGLLPFSFVLDAMHAATRDQSYADAAYYTMIGGFLGGVAAGAAGAMDYGTIPSDSKAKQVGRLHGIMNRGTSGADRAQPLDAEETAVRERSSDDGLLDYHRRIDGLGLVWRPSRLSPRDASQGNGSRGVP